jgi:hypothetical protein
MEGRFVLSDTDTQLARGKIKERDTTSSPHQNVQIKNSKIVWCTDAAIQSAPISYMYNRPMAFQAKNMIGRLKNRTLKRRDKIADIKVKNRHLKSTDCVCHYNRRIESVAEDRTIGPSAHLWCWDIFRLYDTYCTVLRLHLTDQKIHCHLVHLLHRLPTTGCRPPTPLTLDEGRQIDIIWTRKLTPFSTLG